MAYDNTNRGMIRTNDKKSSANHPDMKGVLNVAGVEYWLSGWNKTNDKGDYVSLSVQPMKDSPQAAHSAAKADGYAPAPAGYAKPKPSTTEEFLDDELPPF